MKNTILILAISVSAAFSMSGQEILNNGRPDHLKPSPVVMSQDVLKNDASAQNFEGSDQDNPNEEMRQQSQDVVFPVDFEALKADILSGAQSSDVKTRLDDLTQQVYELTLFNEKLRQENTDIKRSLAQCCTKGKNDASFLIQNSPNPATDLSTVDYYLHDQMEDAQIIISTIQGEVLDTYRLTESGYNSIDISARGYSSGYYVYSLMNQGRVIDSKILIVVE